MLPHPCTPLTCLGLTIIQILSCSQNATCKHCGPAKQSFLHDERHLKRTCAFVKQSMFYDPAGSWNMLDIRMCAQEQLQAKRSVDCRSECILREARLNVHWPCIVAAVLCSSQWQAGRLLAPGPNRVLGKRQVLDPKPQAPQLVRAYLLLSGHDYEHYALNRNVYVPFLDFAVLALEV